MKIAVDTNVLVRLVIQDDPVQSARARDLAQRVEEADGSLFVSNVVLCEAVWVWSGRYKVNRIRLTEILRQLLRTKHVVVEQPDETASAIASYAAGKGDLADYLIRERARAFGCEVVATFDGDLLSEPGFEAP